MALGASERLVGIGRFDPEVPGRGDLPRLGDAFGVNLEALAALEPDAVVVNADLVERRLAPLAGRLRVVRVATDDLAQSRAAVETIAALCDARQAGERLLATLDAARDAATARAVRRRQRGGAAPAVLVVVQHGPFHVAGRGSYVHELLELVGARNVAEDLDAPWPTLGAEALVARRPEVILDSSGGMVDGPGAADVQRAWVKFDTVPAVRDGRVVAVTADVLFRPGPRLPEAIALLEELLYGETGEDE